MNSIDGFRTCRKGLHQYSTNLRTCPECKRESNKEWNKKHRGWDKDYKRQWSEANRERLRQKNNEWVKNNPEKNKKYKQNWKSKNPDKNREYAAWRRAKKKRATPPWADRKAIKKVYDEAKRLEKITGIPHHVDHIYPLTNPYLCGLHVAENLRPIPSSENLSKYNRTWPGQLECQKVPIHLSEFTTTDRG